MKKGVPILICYLVESVLLYLLYLFVKMVDPQGALKNVSVDLLVFIVPWAFSAIICDQKDLDHFSFQWCSCFAILPAILIVCLECSWGVGIGAAVIRGIQIWGINLSALFWYHIIHNYAVLKVKGICFIFLATFLAGFCISTVRNMLHFTKSGNIFVILPLYVSILIYYLYLRKKKIHFREA